MGGSPAVCAIHATAASDTAHKSLTRKTVPQLDPGNIVIGVNGSETTYVLKGEQYVRVARMPSSRKTAY